jgi:hypothetical protein
VVRLIPGFDPYLLGWRSRDLAVPRNAQRQVFPGGGMLRSTVLVDGLAAGTWAVRRGRGRLAVKVQPFSRLGPVVRGSLAVEAADVGRFLDAPAGLAVE